MTFVDAFVLGCLVSSPTKCESKQIKIELRACGTVFRAQISLNGEWQNANITIKCGKEKK